MRCSSLSLIEACPAAALPADPRVESASAAADLGSADHEWLAARIGGTGLVPEIEELAKKYGCDLDELEKLCRCSWRAWEQVQEHFPDPMTEVYLESESGWLSGHADVLSVADGLVRVLDFKTGRQDLDHSAQLKGYCYLAMLQTNTWRAYGCALGVREQTVDGDYYTWQELKEWADALLQSVVDQPKAVYRPGPHCTYCPRSAVCPAKTELLRQSAEAFTSVRPTGTLIWPHADCAQHGAALANLLGHVKLLESACATARDLIRADVAALGGVVPTGDGRELVLREVATRRIDFKAGWKEILRSLTREKLFDALTVSKTKLECAMRDSAPRGQKTAAIKEFLSRLEAAGAIHTTYQTRLEVRRANNTSADQAALAAGDPGDQSALPQGA